MSGLTKALRDYEEPALAKRIRRIVTWPWRQFYYSDLIQFIRNIWRFRKELWEFRAFDFAYNVKILCRSLEITRDFLSDEKKTVACDSAKSAKEIQHFLNLIEEYHNHFELAEKKVGYDITEFSFMFNERTQEQNEKMDRACKLAMHIEQDRWNKAFRFLGRRMNHWWD